MLSLLNKTKVALWHDNFTGAVLIAIHDAVEDMPPVNAVELPCKVGDTVYSPTTTSVEAAIVDHIRLTQDGIYLNLREWHCLSNINRIGKSMFLTREEAEKALEDLKNENK